MKEIIVLLTNKTPCQITVQRRVIPARAVDFPVSVFNLKRFTHELQSACLAKKVTWRLQDEEQVTSDLITFSSLGLTAKCEKALLAAGVESIESLTAMTVEELQAVKGLGQVAVEQIVNKLEFVNLQLKETETDE